MGGRLSHLDDEPKGTPAAAPWPRETDIKAIFPSRPLTPEESARAVRHLPTEWDGGPIKLDILDPR